MSVVGFFKREQLLVGFVCDGQVVVKVFRKFRIFRRRFVSVVW